MPKSNQDPVKRLDEARHKATDYQTQDPEQPPANQPRTMKKWRSLVEERIQGAMAEGRFDNLPGQGKPLAWQKTNSDDSPQELANGILKNNGFAPEWIDRDLVIRRDLEAARETLGSAWRYYQPNPEGNPGWVGAVKRFEEALEKLNRQIDDYNLVVPILSKQRLRLRLEDELDRLKAQD